MKLSGLIAVVLLFVSFAALSAQAQADFVACRAGWDSRFAPNPVYAQGGFSGTYYDTDGKLWFRGGPLFAGSVNVNYEARWDGAEWKGTPVGGMTLGPVSDRGFLNGETYIATSVPTNFMTGQPMGPFAKWNGTAYVRVGTGTNSGGAVQSITPYNGKLYLGGSFSSINGVTAANLATYDGTTFAAVPGIDIAGNFSIYARPIVRDGKMYVIGSFRIGSETLNSYGVAYFDGTSWTRVGPALSGVTGASELLLAFDTAGTPFVTVTNPANDNLSATLELYKLQSGSWQALDTATLTGKLYWASGITRWVRDLSFGPGGGLYTVGIFKTLDGTTTAGGVLKYDGSVWTAGAGTGAEGVVNTVEYDEGKLYVGGQFETLDGKQFGAVAYTTDGTNWKSMISSKALGLGDSANAVAKIGSDIYVGGSFQTAGDSVVNGIARWDGIKWTPLGAGVGMLSTGSRFGESTEPTVWELAAVGTKLYVAGQFETAGGIETGQVAVYDTVAETWSAVVASDTFGSTTIDSFNASGTKLYFGVTDYKSGASTVSTGGFLTYDTATSTFTTGPSLGTSGRAEVIYVDGADVYVGGSFNTGAAAPANRVAKLGSGSWAPLGTGAGNGSVKDIFKFGTDIFVSGSFTSIGGVTTTGLGRWNGSAWSAVGGGAGQSFYTTRFFSDGGKLYLASNGPFAGLTTTGKNGFGYWDSATNTIVGLGASLTPNAVVTSDGVAYFALGGGFSVGCGIASSGFGTYILQPFTNGGGDSDWHNSANWGSGAVPDFNTITTIPGNKTVNITTSDAIAKQLLVEANGTVNIDTGRTLTVDRITINGSITGGGTLEVLNCDESALYRSAGATGYVQTALIRCVNDQGKYLFPVGTATGYAPVTFSDVTGTSTYYMKVKPIEGESTATGLPSTKLPRSWEVTDTCPVGFAAGCANISTATLEFGYIDADISGDENGYVIFSVDAMNDATQKTTVVNVEANRMTVTGVNSFNAFTAGSAAVTSITVSNSNDSGAGSLRDAVANINSGGTITIPGTVTGPINLTTGQIIINKNITIDGPGARNMTIDAGPFSRVFEVQAGNTANISGVKITGGEINCDNGGGILNAGTLNLTDVQVSGNSAIFDGGGIYSTGTLNIVRSTISGNTAGGNGGGVFASGQFSIINSTIGGNTASSNGGGLFVDSATGYGSLGNDTVSGNTAANGGGVFYGLGPVFAPTACAASRMAKASAPSTSMGGSGVTFSSTIVAGNTSTVANPDTDGLFISSGYNFIGDKGSATGFTDATNNDQVGDTANLKDANLRSLGDYGGQTDTYALLYTSPAIDKGTANSLTTDQRSGTFTRTWNKTDVSNASDGTDVGAYEYRKTTTNVTNGNNGGTNSLREAITNAEPGDEITIPATAGPINLTTGSITIDKDLTITGPGARNLTIDGTGNSSGSVVVVNSNVTANISGVTVTGGTGTDNGSGVLQGGGFLNNGKLTLTDVQVKGNTANQGGGVYNAGTAVFTGVRTTVGGGNSANYGGGIFSLGNMTLINSTVAGNSATVDGGGIWLWRFVVGLVGNSTVSANTAGNTGGGFYVAGAAPFAAFIGSATVRSSIIAGNTIFLPEAGVAPSAVGSPDVEGGFISQGFNLIGAGDGSTGFTDGVNNDIVGSVASLQDPLLDPLGSYGGGTDTMRLQSTSQALDKGAANGLTVDQRGGVRTWYTASPSSPFDGTDIGAYEYTFTTAAGVGIGGSVRDSFGRGVSGAQVSVYDTETGAVTVVKTNNFGLYGVSGLEVGRMYVVTVSGRRIHTTVRSFMLYDALTEVDFEVGRQ